VVDVEAFSLQLASKQSLALSIATPDIQQSGKGVVPVAKGAQQGSTGAVAAAGT
jgi:hypothetical protein